MVDAQDTASKFFSKPSRWRTKIFDKAADESPAPKPAKTQDPDDLDDFLKPSTDRAQQHKDTAAVNSRPRIDVARSQRWPGAQAILAGAAAVAKRPGPGGLRTGTRTKRLTVAFVRTLPEVIGHGGDECEDPAILVSRQRQQRQEQQQQQQQQQQHQSQQHSHQDHHHDQNQDQRTSTTATPPPLPRPQDDASLGAHTSAMARTPSQTEQRNSLTRTLTNPAEMSPPLGLKMQRGHINAYVPPPLLPAPQRMGPMGLGERPRGLARAPTGLDQLALDAAAARRPSLDSVRSPDVDDLSPAVAGTTLEPPPALPDDEADFWHRPITRTPTGFQSLADSSVSSSPAPPLPDPGDVATLAGRHGQRSLTDNSSFVAKAKLRMRSEEGRVLHEAAQRAASGSRRDSDASSMHAADCLPVVASVPSSFALLDAGQKPVLPQNDARSTSPASSQYSTPSVASPPPVSPAVRGDTPSTASVASLQRIPSHQDIQLFAPLAQGSIPPMPAPVRSEKGPAPPTPISVSQAAPSLPALPLETTQIPQVIAASCDMPPPAKPIHMLQPSQPSQPTKISQPSLLLRRSDTKMMNDMAYRDFAQRVTHMQGIFQLTAQLGGHMYSRSPSQWIRVATWWFLKGRAGMENQIRSQPRAAEPRQERLTQPHVDLAKVWWILNEVLPDHPSLQSYTSRGPETGAETARMAGDLPSADAFEIQTAINHYMKMLIGSMKKHHSMPPTQALIQGQDQSIWEEYPSFSSDVAKVLTTMAPQIGGTAQNGTPMYRSLSQYMPLADTKGEFCYFRVFVKASLPTDDPSTDRVPMSAVLSALRPKDQYQIKLAVCSQSSLLNIVVGPGSDITWKDVTWNKQSRKISIQLCHGFTLTLELNDSDMRSLWTIIDHTNRAETDLRERRDERFSCKLYLREASYKDPVNPAAFPPERVPGCKLMVFQKIERSSEGTGKRKLHRGYRMALVTPQQYKQVSLVNHELGTQEEPMNFEYVTEHDQTPALRLHFREEAADTSLRVCTVNLVFQESTDRNHLFGAFTSMNVNESEMAFAQVPLKAFHVESADPAESFGQRGSRILDKMHWQEAKVLNVDPEVAGLESAPTIKSESLRIVCRHTAGIISDRMNLGSGELLVRLPTDGATELTLLREPQEDVAVAIDGSRSERGVLDAFTELLRTLKAASTIRRLTFNSYQDLHTFQLAVTGFAVKFDGIALTFSISRRRMVVPIYKQWTANRTRIQIVQQDNIIQLLAFFEDFSHADAMNFQLRTMDTFEKSDKGGKYGLKLVDAKFALPVEERRGEGKMQKEEGRLTGWSGVKRRFVCLDEIEYPGEHDDILVQFDSAETRDYFAEALPAATIARRFTVRRKI